MTLGDMKKLVSPMPFPPDPSPPTSLHVYQFRPCKVPPTQICLLYQHHCYFSETLIVTSLPTPTSILVFLLFATHVLGLKRPGLGTQGAGHLGGGGFLFGQSDCQHHSFPHWMGPSDVTFPPWVLGVLPAELPLLPLGGCGGIRWPVGVHPFKKPTGIK